jgi:hypothetical protein
MLGHPDSVREVSGRWAQMAKKNHGSHGGYTSDRIKSSWFRSAKAKTPGWYGDGRGLYCVVRHIAGKDDVSRRWVTASGVLFWKRPPPGQDWALVDRRSLVL